MPERFALRRLLLWLCAWAVLAGSIAPAVSRLLHAGQGAWLEVCSIQGNKRILLVAADSSSDAPGAPVHQLAIEHCPYCLPHAGTLALPPPGGLSFALVAPPLLAILPLAPPFRAGAGDWPAANPRAPPVSFV